MDLGEKQKKKPPSTADGERGLGGSSPLHRADGETGRGGSSPLLVGVKFGVKTTESTLVYTPSQQRRRRRRLSGAPTAERDRGGDRHRLSSGANLPVCLHRIAVLKRQSPHWCTQQRRRRRVNGAPTAERDRGGDRHRLSSGANLPVCLHRIAVFKRQSPHTGEHHRSESALDRHRVIKSGPSSALSLRWCSPSHNTSDDDAA